jgi:carboxylesterase
MDPNKTSAFDLGEGDRACLLLHGFTGSPWDVRPLGEALAQRGYRVRAIRLPGHGTTPEAMAGVSHRDWEAAAESALFSLSGVRHTFIAGLSVGALLAVLLAARYPERITGLALIAPALRLKGALVNVLRLLHAVPVVQLVRPYVEKVSTDISDISQREEAPLLAAFPVARLRDVWELQDAVQPQLSHVSAPTLVVVAKNDHVVSLQGARELARGLKNARSVRWVQLEEGFHIIPRDKGAAMLIEEVALFFDQCGAAASDAA